MTSALWAAAQFLYLYAPLLLSAAISGVVMRFDWLRALRRPIDFGLTFRGKRVFGDSKTWRGLAVAVGGCVLGATIQRYAIGARAGSLALLDYETLDIFAFGAAMGGTAIAGELPNSFVKRRLDIAPGTTASGPLSILFYVWDQIDLLTLSLPALSYWVRMDLKVVLTGVIVGLMLHPLTSLIGYVMGARRSAR
jgi:hypothetical protein